MTKKSNHNLENIAQLNSQQRAEIFNETAATLGLTAVTIEKDFWVCWVLQKIFSNTYISKKVLFKGGTTLSKCYNLIERFSEDIDLILDWRVLTDENPYDDRSNTKQDKFNKKMEVNAQRYIRKTLMPLLVQILGEYCHLYIDEDKLKSVMVQYPKAFESEYIKPEIELEFGPMSAMIPKSTMTIEPYCAEIAEAIIKGGCRLDVRVIEAKKTFWDKVTILHVESHRPRIKNQPARYSRHYYDLYQMLNSQVKNDALNDLVLLNTTVNFKAKFYPQGWENYEAAKLGQFSLVPEHYRIKQLKDDYKQMEEMIFGQYPDFDKILSEIKLFEKELNIAINKQ